VLGEVEAELARAGCLGEQVAGVGHEGAGVDLLVAVTGLCSWLGGWRDSWFWTI